MGQRAISRAPLWTLQRGPKAKVGGVRAAECWQKSRIRYFPYFLRDAGTRGRRIFTNFIFPRPVPPLPPLLPHLEVDLVAAACVRDGTGHALLPLMKGAEPPRRPEISRHR